MTLFQKPTPWDGDDDDYDSVTDFRSALANHASSFGIWPIDANTVVLDGAGRILSIPNFRTNGPALVQPNAARRAYLIYDTTLRRWVADFRPADQSFYLLDGYNFVSRTPWTGFGIAKPNFSNDAKFFFGSFEGGNDTSGVFQTGQAANPRAFRMLIANQTAIADGREGWNRVVAGSTSGAAKVAKISVNGGEVGVAQGGANVDPLGSVFYLSHPAAPFSGQVSCLGGFMADFFSGATATDALYNLVRDYLDDRYGGVV